jgi:glycosyltransferase involved in cell wall biosynthesis
MRIAHVAPSVGSSASGIMTVLVQLTTAIARRGHDVELWYDSNWHAPTLSAMISTLADTGVQCHRVETSRRRGSLLPKVALPADTTPDVLHVHSAFVPMNTSVIRAWSRPVVVSPHGGFDPASLKRGLLRKRVYSVLYEKRALRRSAVVVALTEVEAAQVRAYAGNVISVVVPNGVAPRPTESSGTPFRRRVGIPADARIALFVGRLDVRHKGLDRLVAATAAAPSWQFVLIGPDYRGGRRQLQQRATDYGTPARLHFVGQLEGATLANAYAAADLFVLPSRWEGLPMSLLEALVQGVPSLVTPEVDRLVPVSQSGAGWVSAPAELGTTLEALATLPPAEWSRRAEAARELAQRYNWDDVAAAYEEIYRTALRRWTPSGATTRRAVPR